ncbi:MAG: hypothetical protein IPO45_16995 [Saprospiraceae bacterium]|nr:hypothetical protein [Candidatus Brachybacter algidus]
MKNLTFLLIFISITFSALAQRAYIKDKDNRNTGYFEKNNEGVITSTQWMEVIWDEPNMRMENTLS